MGKSLHVTRKGCAAAVAFCAFPHQQSRESREEPQPGNLSALQDPSCDPQALSPAPGVQPRGTLCLWEDLTRADPAFQASGLQAPSLSQLVLAPSAYTVGPFAPSGLFLIPLPGLFSLPLTPPAACPRLCPRCSNTEKGRIPGARAILELMPAPLDPCFSPQTSQPPVTQELVY